MLLIPNHPQAHPRKIQEGDQGEIQVDFAAAFTFHNTLFLDQGQKLKDLEEQIIKEIEIINEHDEEYPKVKEVMEQLDARVKAELASEQ